MRKAILNDNLSLASADITVYVDPADISTAFESEKSSLKFVLAQVQQP
jgi:hypothetical protein